MENKTILDILQKKKELGSFADGDKLYSPCLGNCILVSTNDYCVDLAKDSTLYPSQKMQLRNDGRLFSEGEIMAFPSEKMRDWSKFAWEKYTLLEKGRSKRVFFEKWASPDYTRFTGVDFVLDDNSVKVHRSTYMTSYYHSVAEEECEAFYKTLFYYSGKKSFPFLAESNPLYKEVTDKLARDIRKKEKESREGREVLEALTKKAILADVANGFELIKGKLYYFEDVDKKMVSFIAQFNHFSVNKKYVFFDRSVMSAGHKNVIYGDMSRKPESCLKFREATDAEENKFERVIEELKSSLVPFTEGNYYAFSIEDNFCYFGKLVSFEEDKSNFVLSDVYCTHSGNKPQYFKEKRFITCHCKNLRLASYSDKCFFGSVKASYYRSQKETTSLKPKDWCLMRDDDDAPWELCQYAYDDSNEADGKLLVAIGGNSFHQCIPYEGNEELLGTSISPDDGKW